MPTPIAKHTYITPGDYLLRILEVGKGHTPRCGLFFYVNFEVLWNYGSTAVPVGQECTWFQLKKWGGSQERFIAFITAVLGDSVAEIIPSTGLEAFDCITVLREFMPGNPVYCRTKEMRDRLGRPHYQSEFRRYNPLHDPRDADPVGRFPQEGLPCCHP